MICIAVSVNHHACAQPDQVTKSVPSSANASALLKRTVATGEGAGRWTLRSFSVLYAGGLFLNPASILNPQSLILNPQKGSCNAYCCV